MARLKIKSLFSVFPWLAVVLTISEAVIVFQWFTHGDWFRTSFGYIDLFKLAVIVLEAWVVVLSFIVLKYLMNLSEKLSLPTALLLIVWSGPGLYLLGFRNAFRSFTATRFDSTPVLIHSFSDLKPDYWETIPPKPYQDDLSRSGLGDLSLISIRAVGSTMVYFDRKPSLAVDGDTSTIWHSGGFPLKWIRLEFSRSHQVDKIRLLGLVDGSKGVHHIWGLTSLKEVRFLGSLKGVQNEGEWLEMTLPDDTPELTTLQVITFSESDPATWNEIEVWGTSY